MRTKTDDKVDYLQKIQRELERSVQYAIEPNNQTRFNIHSGAIVAVEKSLHDGERPYDMTPSYEQVVDICEAIRRSTDMLFFTPTTEISVKRCLRDAADDIGNKAYNMKMAGQCIIEYTALGWAQRFIHHSFDWCKGHDALDENDKPVPWTDHEARKFSLNGAIMRACDKIDPYDGGEIGKWCWNRIIAVSEHMYYWGQYKIPSWEWNDHSCRGHHEVKQVLQMAVDNSKASAVEHVMLLRKCAKEDAEEMVNRAMWDLYAEKEHSDIFKEDDKWLTHWL